MVSLRNLYVVVASLVSLEMCADVNVVAPRLNQAFSLAAIAGIAVLLGNLMRLFQDSREPGKANEQNVAIRYTRLKERVISIWCIGYPALLFATSWTQWLAHYESAGLPPVLAILLIISPHVLFLFMTELAASSFESLISKTSVWQVFKLRIRLGEISGLAICLAPILVVNGANDLVASQLDSELAETVSAGAVACSALLFAFLYPLLAGRWFRVREIENESLRARFRFLLKACGIRALRVVEVPSEGRWCTAAVVGWFPWTRQMWIGDGLQTKLSLEEVDMVFLHEAAHIKRHHFVYRLIPIVWAGALSVAYLAFASNLSSGFMPEWLGTILSMFMSILVLLVGLGIVSKSCELDADREACALAEQHCEWARQRPGLAAVRLASSLSTVLGASKETAKAGWLHPSLHDRLANLANDLAARKAALRINDGV